jgi:hypothetical protein
MKLYLQLVLSLAKCHRSTLGLELLSAVEADSTSLAGLSALLVGMFVGLKASHIENATKHLRAHLQKRDDRVSSLVIYFFVALKLKVLLLSIQQLLVAGLLSDPIETIGRQCKLPQVDDKAAKTVNNI